MRKDAIANRDKLIQAGRRVMQDEGGDVPVERICALAGVTRGTFYRNFPDRAALYEAVLEAELATMTEAIARVQDDPLAFIRLFSEMMMVYDRFLANLPDMDDYPEHDGNEVRIIAVLASPLTRAKKAGLIKADVTGDDVLLSCRMIAANWRHDREPSREAAMERRLALMMQGLGTVPAKQSHAANLEPHLPM